jgi:purine catabolism regulator
VKAALLAEALDPAPARDPLPLAARAAAFGLDFTQPARVVVVRGGDGARVERALIAELERAHVPYLAQRRETSLSALVQCRDGHADAALAAVADAFPDVVIGVGRAVATMGEAHHSLRDAELAADRAAPAGRPIVRFEDFDVATFVVAEIAPERLRPKLEEIHSVLRANPPLHEALAAYFEHDLDIGATAEALHMHRNSLRYRLARFEHLLGRSLKQPATIAAVHIALVADGGAGRATKDAQ